MVVESPDQRIQKLVNRAENVFLTEGINMQQYLRTGRSMFNMVEQFIQNGQKDKAFILATKFANLYLVELPKHWEYGNLSAESQREWNCRCKHMLRKALRLKEELKVKFQREYDEYLGQSRRESSAAASATAVAATLPSAPVTSYDLPDRALNLNIPSTDLPAFPSVPSDMYDGDSTAFATPPVCQPPKFDRSLKPTGGEVNSLKINDSPVNPYGWCTVRFPTGIVDSFLELSNSNTKCNRETCGNLCGRCVGNEFIITHLVIPKQTGTPDSCTTHKEEEMFEYMDAEGLIVLGWIHTHPTQTAFLSSVDQHCQLSYQLMLPEAIAIVCSPKHNEVGYFSLTPEDGIPLLRSCRQTGFHKHSNIAPIFEPCKHVFTDVSLPYVVKDLR